MKKITYLSILVLAINLISCKKEQAVNYTSFGKEITLENAISAEQMGEKFANLKAGDTIDVKFATKIDAVCKKKGCWMKVPVGKEQSFVKFKDYGFFMPMNSEESEIVLNGKAFVKEISVAQLQHYAKDAGKSEEEIAKITQPERTLSFLADGVLMKVEENAK